VNGRTRLLLRRNLMAVLAVGVGVGGIVLGAQREEAWVASTAASPSTVAPASTELRFVRRDDPARTTVVDAAGTVLATFTDGARTVTLGGPERGDASFGPPPPPGSPPIENNDFYDYLGVDWSFVDGARREPDPVRYGTVDCSGFVRLVYGFRAGYPLIPTNDRGPGLPRRARGMAENGPGVTLLPDTGGIPTDLGVLQAGDLLFFDLDKTPDGRTDHVAIYLGRDESGGHRFVSSRVRADGPTLGDLGGTSLLDDGGYYAGSFRSAKRL
jgi:cell wall-associated NlpC family hydrolase